MKTSCDEMLNRFIRQLSCEYDMNSPEEIPLVGFPSMPLHLSPETCSIPCLSILTPPNCVRMYFDASNKIDQSQHEDLINLMSRKVKYQRHSLSFASFLLMRNLVFTFGSILEYTLQRTIFNVMDAKSKSTMKEDEEIVKKFTDLPATIKNEPLVIPELAVTSFSTVLPLKTWQEMGHDHVSLRLVFQAEITVRIVPSNRVCIIPLKVPGVAVGVFNNLLNVPAFIEIDIDTKALYNAIRRECKIVSKNVVNSIVGFELLRQKNKVSSPKSASGTAMKQLQIISDNSTSRTEQTTNSSDDGKDYISPSVDHDGSNINQTLNTNKSFDNNSPRRKNRSMKLIYKYHEQLHGETKSSSLGSIELTSSTLPDDANVTQKNDVFVINEERNDEILRENKCKKRDSVWKRFVSPHKIFQV